MKLSPPWITYLKKIECLFKDDPEISTEYDEDKYSLKLYVSNEEKAEALSKLLPMTKEFGNVTMTITVVPPNKTGVNYLELFRKAFQNNPAVTDITSIEMPFSAPTNFVIFKKEVVQFFNDDISDAHGVCSTLNENIAREVFGTTDNVYFCTDIK